MTARANILRRLSRAVRRRREPCRLLTEVEDREPSAEEQRAWLEACEEARLLRERAEGRE